MSILKSFILIMNLSVVGLIAIFCANFSHQASMDIKVLNSSEIFNSEYGKMEKKIDANSRIEIYVTNRTVTNLFVSVNLLM